MTNHDDRNQSNGHEHACRDVDNDEFLIVHDDDCDVDDEYDLLILHDDDSDVDDDEYELLILHDADCCDDGWGNDGAHVLHHAFCGQCFSQECLSRFSESHDVGWNFVFRNQSI